jgi:hypothetical protein
VSQSKAALKATATKRPQGGESGEVIGGGQEKEKKKKRKKPLEAGAV